MGVRTVAGGNPCHWSRNRGNTAATHKTLVGVRHGHRLRRRPAPAMTRRQGEGWQPYLRLRPQQPIEPCLPPETGLLTASSRAACLPPHFTTVPSIPPHPTGPNATTNPIYGTGAHPRPRLLRLRDGSTGSSGRRPHEAAAPALGHGGYLWLRRVFTSSRLPVRLQDAELEALDHEPRQRALTPASPSQDSIQDFITDTGNTSSRNASRHVFVTSRRRQTTARAGSATSRSPSTPPTKGRPQSDCHSTRCRGQRALSAMGEDASVLTRRTRSSRALLPEAVFTSQFNAGVRVTDVRIRTI